MTIHSVVIQKLLSTNAHLGRNIAAHHFKIFTYGARNNMAIIDSDRTLICLRSACNFIAALARQRAQFMFVNTNTLYDEIFEQMTARIGIKFDNKWGVGGYLTNSFSPKKFRSRNKKFTFSPARLPDCLVIVDTERKSSIISEAAKMGIPIVSLVDSNIPSDIYRKITYPVPANDSVQFVYLFCNLITKTFQLEQKGFLPMLDTVRGKVGGQPLPAPNTEDWEEKQLIDESKVAGNSVLVVAYESLAPISDDSTKVKELLDKLIVLKLNDALGTSMGFNGSKSAIEIHGTTCLDSIITQIQCLNSKYGCKVPLFLMNSVETHDDALKIVGKYSKADIDIHTFSQNENTQVNDFDGKISEDKMCPPDQGRTLFSFMSGGTLEVLLRQGKEYILIVDADNLAAVVDPKILNHMVQNKIDCCSEVTPTSLLHQEDDASVSKTGKVQLSEIAQLPAKNSVEKFKFIDTKSLWANLHAIKGLVETDALNRRNYPALEEKDANKSLLQGASVGSALQLFDHSVGITVPRSRYFPLLETSDLLLAQSDLYSSIEGCLVRNEARKIPMDPVIKLGPEFAKFNDFRSRFKSIPSIIELDSLKVTGDVWFGAGVTLKGKILIAGKAWMKLEIPDGAIIENKVITGPRDI